MLLMLGRLKLTMILLLDGKLPGFRQRHHELPDQDDVVDQAHIKAV